MQDLIGTLLACGDQNNGEGSVYQDADLRHWAKMPCWSHLELTCVTLGFEPDPILTSTADQLKTDLARLDLITKRSQLAYRAVEIGDLPRCITPKRAIEWLESIGESSPEDLKEAVISLPIYAKGPLEQLSGTDLNTVVEAITELTDIVKAKDGSSVPSGAQTKEIASLHKIVLTMAVKGYGYDPKVRRTAVYGEIAGDSDKMGLNLRVDTVRKHVRLATDNYWNQPDD
jgi:hypothetical protein